MRRSAWMDEGITSMFFDNIINELIVEYIFTNPCYLQNILCCKS